MLSRNHGGLDLGHNDHMPDYQEFIGIAIEAGALKACPIHSDVTINQCNPDAERRAYAMATNKWKAGELFGDREDIMEGVKDAIDQSADECPVCSDFRDA